MRINSVRHALAQGRVQIGTNFGQLRSPEVGRLLAAAGFEWAFVDMEHGGFDLETVQDICRVSTLTGLAPIVRVGELQYTLVARALDCGAQGIIFPRIEDAEALARAVSWTKFPPAGVRGYGLTQMHAGYEALSFEQMIEHFNTQTLVVVQIESQRGVDARDEILSVPGIDAVMIGPADLSISLGVPGQFEHPRMVQAMEAIRDTCVAKNIAPGTQTRSLELAKFWKARGMRFLGCSAETTMLFEKAREIATALRAE